jgi:hypothetical protein
LKGKIKKMKSTELCYGCAVTERCVTDKPEIAKLCPCQECILKMRCSYNCDKWDAYLKEHIAPIIEARFD